jgi:hypothetical protein
MRATKRPCSLGRRSSACVRGPAGRMRGAAQLRRPRSGDARLRVRVRCRLGDGRRPGRARGGRRRHRRVLLAGRRGRRARRALSRVPPCSSTCSNCTGRRELGAPLPHVPLLCIQGRLNEPRTSSRALTACVARHAWRDVSGAPVQRSGSWHPAGDSRQTNVAGRTCLARCLRVLDSSDGVSFCGGCGVEAGGWHCWAAVRLLMHQGRQRAGSQSRSAACSSGMDVQRTGAAAAAAAATAAKQAGRLRALQPQLVPGAQGPRECAWEDGSSFRACQWLCCSMLACTPPAGGRRGAGSAGGAAGPGAAVLLAPLPPLLRRLLVLLRPLRPLRARARLRAPRRCRRSGGRREGCAGTAELPPRSLGTHPGPCLLSQGSPAQARRAGQA